ncbi:target of Myb protein 1-like isoform X1 [Scophthalmus maximus]|uniref:target of Myb protein 1-like isoform X1 n=2 Tax=Scophthalmus maximus TaxID=52904 RepID=UPI001FA84391|nr:target of Myb protein 1-like isoform X1 [Scophthalmus maximus]
MIGCAANSGLNWTRGRRLEIKKAAVPNKATRKHQSGAQRLPNYSHTHWTGRLTIIRAMFSIGEKMEFLIGNPFSTPVGQRVERATIGSLQSEDWGLNIEICDIINETDEGPRDAVKAIKKRIIGNKNFREIMLALTVLEACVKNCGHRFHILVGSQEFVEGVLVRCILPKYNPPTTLHDRVLSLIQSWADAFRSSPSLAGVVYVYDDLRRRGLEFPMTDLDALSPIHTPNRSIPENGTPEMAAVAPATHPPQPQVPPEATTLNTSPPVQPNERPESLSAEQEQKLRSELALVKGNLTVMSEMLNELVPGQSQPDDTELLQQLYTVCKCMQTRVVELIPQLLDEGFIEEMLVVNDDLNNAFIRYERFDRLNKAQITQSTQQQSSTSSPSVIKVSTELPTLGQPAVITTTNQPAVSTWANQRQLANHKEEEEFDMFAQTRGSSLAEQRKSVRYEDPGAVEGLAGALDTRLQVTGGMPPTKNFLHNDIDKWLSCDMEEQSSVCEGVSSEEFDKFLEDRARAGDHSSQGIRSVPSSASRPQPQSTRQQDRSHDQLFSL